MLLRVGVVSMAAALLLAAATVVYVGFRGERGQAQSEAPTEEVAETGATPQPVARADEPEEPRERPRRESRAEPRERVKEESPEPEPMTEEGWDKPTREELAATRAPRRYAPAPGAAFTVTIPRLQVYDAPVFDSDSAEALYAGVAHVPETSMPWDGGEQTNVYLAAHRIGYYGSGSRLVFYHLDDLARGDEVILNGRGETYRYRVTEKFSVHPGASWVMGQVVGKHMVSLQTCTPIPTFEYRLVVRAERV